MRTGGALFHTTHLSENTASEATNTAKATFSPPATIQHSPWHSPVPYLFGGLAAMLGLIAFALLILACSYWKLSGHEDNGEGDGGATEKGESSSDDKALHVFEEKYLVIMAGDVKPTYLATPMSSKTSSFNDDQKQNGKETENTKNPINEDQLTPTEEETEGSQPSQEQIH
ncbi:protein GLUTAMINE DUMPER 1-like [Dorcoceras hygrometricum]|uniref:Protein GLUTAMINE DUMPER 1-like n=1 Tax=Dorcoceras hygrometricum TaxID=472368 RepID=A0A2Z7BIB6_9LAMI|nr:protein GLUTAMINE DUMPER 1-like [Dorcoceras hygrometricum]